MITISLSKLGNQELFTLGKRVSEILSAVDTEKMGIKLYADNFSLKFDAYKKSFEKLSVSAEQVAQKDALRDDYYIALRNTIRNFNYHPSTALKEKARKILGVLNKNGNQIYALNYKAESAALTSIISEIDKNWLTDVTEMGAHIWFNLLKPAQADFETTVSNFTAEKAENIKVTSATTARPEIEDAIRKLFTFLPLQYEMTQAPELSDLMGQLQVAADRF
ncbi:MAG: hypothetical protein JEZ09_17090 [Salinivirgaceae bacterium]|nr:hypothetical protein [Salinivirgaceae bacterium]